MVYYNSKENIWKTNVVKFRASYYLTTDSQVLKISTETLSIADHY